MAGAAETYILPEESLEEQFIRLQVEEIEHSRAQAKGKQSVQEADDFDTALNFFLADLQPFGGSDIQRRILQNRTPGPIQALVPVEEDAITVALVQEEAAKNDRHFARSIGASQKQKKAVEITSKLLNDEHSQQEEFASLLEELGRWTLKDGQSFSTKPLPSQSIPHAESSTTAARRPMFQFTGTPQPKPVERKECTACADNFPVTDLAKLPCEHQYCRGCITKLFADSIFDESLFPPRCCRERIELERVQAFLDAKVVADFQERREELETTNKTYCRVPTCSKFIPNDSIRNSIGVCKACGTSTCSICKGAPHIGFDCPEDTALNAVLDTARDAQWQRCYACRNLVELTIGCNHITCRCGAQFCYECGAAWRTCQCAHWREDRLLARAQQIQERAEAEVRRLPRPVQAVQPPVPQVAQIAANLRVDHACDHVRSWQNIQGRYQCEQCRNIMPYFIYECQRCRTRECGYCRRHRW